MPPEVKPVISSLAEMTCENCVFSHESSRLTCANPASPNWCIEDNEFCSKGTWRLVVAQNRVSLGCYEVCYDYLTELK